MAGMEAMQQKFGKLKWADLFAPAIYYAENGVTLNASTAGFFNWRKSRSEEHTSELQSLMRISYAVFCLKKKKKQYDKHELPHKQIHTHKLKIHIQSQKS